MNTNQIDAAGPETPEKPRTSRVSVAGLICLLVSLTSIPIGLWAARHTEGDFQPLAVAAFHVAWGAVACLLGAALSLAGLFCPPRTALAWVAFGLAIAFTAGFACLVCALVL